MKYTKHIAAAAGLCLGLLATPLKAGPFILAGTDSEDHGFFSGGNQDGWFFMQRALENLAGQVTNGNKQVVFLGSNIGSQAGNAGASAFNNSSLPGLGWTSLFLNDAAVDTFLSGGLVGAGIIVMDSADNTSGGANGTELGYFNTHATAIDNYLGAGGGLFSQANDFAWVATLIPALTVVDLGGGGQGDNLSLTAAGMSAFPGLTNGDLSSGPYHNIFSNTAGLPVLATNTSGQAVIIGSSGGRVTNPNVPEGGSFAAIYGALLSLLFLGRRRLIGRS